VDCSNERLKFDLIRKKYSNYSNNENNNSFNRNRQTNIQSSKEMNCSYSEIFLKKKGQVDPSNNNSKLRKSLSKEKLIESNNGNYSNIIDKDNILLKDNKNLLTSYEHKNAYSIDPKIPPMHPQTTKHNNIRQNNFNNYNRSEHNYTNQINYNNNRSIHNSQTDSIDLSNISQGKQVIPKTNFKYHNEIIDITKNNEIKKGATSNLNSSRSNSGNKYYNGPIEHKSRSINTIEGGLSTVELYLQRRHTEAQTKLLRLKNEQIKKEAEELRDRPKISNNSRRIVERIRQSNPNVFERLTSRGKSRKKPDEINKIEEMNRKNSNKLTINETSGKLQRTIDDLYYWQKELNVKKEEIKDKHYKVCKCIIL
jgi:hypothetical protein